MSNKTPSDNPEKTGLALKLSGLVFIVLFLALVGAFWIKGQSKQAVPTSDCYINVNLETTIIRAGEVTFQAETARTSVDQQQGLSNRDCLDEDRAMLFSYEKPGNYCFWMEGMSFPIDMVWLGADKKVVTIKQNAEPTSYPGSFCPESPAQYVVEVNAGTAQSHSWQTSTQFSF